MSDMLQDTDATLIAEPEPFKEELNNFKDNILYTLMDLIGPEIDRLPSTQREVIVRYYLIGESLTKIGAALKISFQAVDYRKKRAVRALKKRLLCNPYAVELYKQFLDVNPTINALVKISELLGK